MPTATRSTVSNSNRLSLKSQHDNLEVDSARLQSLNRVNGRHVAKHMVAVAPSATAKN